MSGIKMRGEFVRGLGRLEGWRASPGSATSLESAVTRARGDLKADYGVEITGEFLDQANQPLLVMGILIVPPKAFHASHPASTDIVRKILDEGRHEKDAYGFFVSRMGVIWRMERIEARTAPRSGREFGVVWLRHIGTRRT